MSINLGSYPKVYAIGHRAIRGLFDGPVVVQEKIDGSQFSFGVIDGVLRFRSRNREIHPPVDDKLFSGAVATAQALHEEGRLVEGWIYRGEAMCAPRHNTLQYERAPKGNFVLFDIDTGLEDRMPEGLEDVAEALGLEVVPEFFRGEVESHEHLKELLTRESMLGGAMEGVVAKNYARWGQDGKMMMGKLVRDEFKEQHRKNWKPGDGKDVVQRIIETYKHERRWAKAVERRRDDGELQDAPQDIGPLLHSIQADVEAECVEEIKDKLWGAFRRQILAGVTSGFPYWYKERLAELQFSGAGGS